MQVNVGDVVKIKGFEVNDEEENFVQPDTIGIVMGICNKEVFVYEKGAQGIENPYMMDSLELISHDDKISNFLNSKIDSVHI